MEILVFTNGCFDLLHPGHIDLLKKARALGTKLIVGLNSDRSVRAIKGSTRPFLNQRARAAILQELRAVDEVRIFDGNTPEKMIREIKPDVLVKGGDWTIDQIVGADFVLKNGGKVFSIPFVENFSTSKIAEKIKSAGECELLSVSDNTIESDFIKNFLQASLQAFENLLINESTNISRCAEIIVETVKNGNKIFFVGEQGSLEVAQYLFAKFAEANKNLPKAIAPLAGISNQLNKNAQEGDLLFVLTLSGHSEKMISAVMEARRSGCRIIALTGSDSVKIASLCDAGVSVSGSKPEIITPVQIAIGNLWSELI